MGKAKLPPDGISIPRLAELMGVRHTAVYEMIRRGKGPRLTPVEVGPWAKYQPVKNRSSYVRLDHAIEWLEGRSATKWADAIRTLKIEKIMASLKEPITIHVKSPRRPIVSAAVTLSSRRKQTPACGYKIFARHREAA